MSSSIQDYIQETIRKNATIKYDPSVKEWAGILHHESGSIYSQQKTKAEVVKEMSEVLEEFLVRFFQEKTRPYSSAHRVKAHPAQVSRLYRQA